MNETEIKKQIVLKLSEIEQQEHVKILHAAESGSRAWGFASPDSDFDVRFIYVREKDEYLKLNPGRDVIEYQLDDVFDVSGWDFQKMLKLLYILSSISNSNKKKHLRFENEKKATKQVFPCNEYVLSR